MPFPPAYLVSISSWMVQGAVLQKKEGINNKEREKNLKISKFALLIVLLEVMRQIKKILTNLFRFVASGPK